MLHSDRQSSCGCFGSRSSSCVTKHHHGSGAGTWLAAECRTLVPGVFCIVLFWECGDRLVRGEESVETYHSLCSLDPSK